MGWKTETASTQIQLGTSDTQDIGNHPKGIFVIVAGVVSWIDDAPAGSRHTHTATLEIGVYPIQISRLLTATTATVLGLYD